MTDPAAAAAATTEPAAAAVEATADAVDEIVEVVFEDHYMLAAMAFIAGMLIIGAIVYYIGTREDKSDAEE